MSKYVVIKTVNPSEPEEVQDSALVVHWEHEECTHRTASEFARLTRKVSAMDVKRVILDMSECQYISVSGLRYLMEWHSELYRAGIEMRVSGLTHLTEKIFRISKLDWVMIG